MFQRVALVKMTDRFCQPKWKHDKYGCGIDVIADLKGEKWLAVVHNEYLKEFGQVKYECLFVESNGFSYIYIYETISVNISVSDTNIS